jgi:rhodanese-related sulfurtransferase
MGRKVPKAAIHISPKRTFRALPTGLKRLPAVEFASAHLPHARSMPVDELKKRLAELPKKTPVVAYCQGPFCLMAKDAVELLGKKGNRAFHLTDSMAEWRAHGLPIEE